MPETASESFGNTSRERGQELLPVVASDVILYSVEPQNYFPACVDAGQIYRIERQGHLRNEPATDYALRIEIGGEEYLFWAVKSFNYPKGVYSLDYKTKRYEYALMELSKEEREELEATIISFIDTVFRTDDSVEILRFSGAPSTYTRHDIDEARALLMELKGYSKDHVDSLDPHVVEDALPYGAETRTSLQRAKNNAAGKRRDVFAYRLEKLFTAEQLPYEVVASPYLSNEAEIRRK
jgi:hypothetical protein